MALAGTLHDPQVSINELQSTIAAMSTAMSGMQASMDDGLGAAMVNVQAAATERAIANGKWRVRVPARAPSSARPTMAMDSRHSALAFPSLSAKFGTEHKKGVYLCSRSPCRCRAPHSPW